MLTFSSLSSFLPLHSTRLANDNKTAAKAGGKAGERQFTGLIDVYRKTLKTDGIQVRQ